MKRIFTAIVILLSALGAYAANLIAEGNYGTCHWYITGEGKLVVEPTNGTEGTLDNLTATTDVPWYPHHDAILSAEIKSGVTANTCSYFFMNCKNLQSVDLSGLNTLNATDMRYMFYGCNSLTALNMSSLNTQSLTSTKAMFGMCSHLTYIDMTGFNATNVTEMTDMFAGCESLKYIYSNAATPSTLKTGFFSESFVKRADCTLYVPEGSRSAYLKANGWKEIGTVDDGTQIETIAKGVSGTCRWYITKDEHKLVIDHAEGITRTMAYWSGADEVPWHSWLDEIYSVEIKHGVTAKTCSYFFMNCKNLQSVDLSGLNTQDVTDMGYMFYGCSSLTAPDLSSLNMQNVTDMRYMFYGCSSFTSLDLSKLNTQKVRNMKAMFSMCTGLKTFDITRLNTESVTDMSMMFKDCTSLTSLTMRNLNTQNVTDMRYMFYGCNSLTTLDTSNLNTQSLTSTKAMFGMCSHLTYIDMTGFNATNVTEMTDMFAGCESLKYIYSNAATPSTLKTGFFSESFVKRADCTLYVPEGSRSAYLKANGWKEIGTVDDGTQIETIAKGVSGTCRWYITKDEHKLVIDHAEGITRTMAYWSGADEVPWHSWLDEIYSVEIKHGVTAKTCSYFFMNCKNLQSVDLSGLNTQDVTDMGYMFYGCSSLTAPDLSSLNMQNVTDMRYMFYGCSSLTSLDLSKLNTQNVRNMKAMFSMCTGLKTFDITRLNTESVTDMSMMFKDCTSLTSLTMRNLNTQNVTDMRYMFYGCNSLTTLDMSNLNTQSLTSTKAMFGMCSHLTSIDMTGFTATNVTEMTDMFAGCESLKYIYSNAATPSTLNTGFFESFAKRADCTLYVPEGSRSAYLKANGWKEIGTVDDGTQIETIAKGVSGTCRWYITKDEHKLVIHPAESVIGTLGNWSSAESVPWNSWHDEILSAEVRYGVTTNTCCYFFINCKNLQSVDLSGLNTLNVTDMRYMFYGCSSLTALDLSKLNTQNVRNMKAMFSMCTGLKTFDITRLNTESVTDMSMMFKDCTSLTSLTMRNLNTQNVTDMRYMFYGCNSLMTLDMSNLNTQSLTSTKSMFGMCSHLESLNMSDFSTKNVTEMTDMFAGCAALKRIYSDAATPSSLKVGTFSGSFEKRADCTLYVPVGSRDAYLAAAGWNELGATISSFTSGDFVYNEISSAQRTVEVVGFTDRTVEEIDVPATADFEGVTSYKVVSVGNRAFANIPQLLEVTFKGVVAIPADAFEGSDIKTNLFVYAPAGSTCEYKGNVVIDGKAENVVLKDAQPLRISSEFTAKKVSYSREFTKKTYPGKAGGWETIVLPFEVQHIESEQGELTPFSGNADGKHFWLAYLRSTGFTNSSSIDPNTPYIISMPNSDEYDSAYNICGTVTFSANNARVYPTSNAQSKDGNDFRLVPTYEGVKASASVYAINDEDISGYYAGAVFASAIRDVRPFEAYAENLQNGAKPLFFEIESTATGIRDIHMEGDVPTAAYDLSGRPVSASQKGFVIIRDAKGKHKKIYNK